MKRLAAIALLLLLAGCFAGPGSGYDPAPHGGGPGPGNHPINPSVDD